MIVTNKQSNSSWFRRYRLHLCFFAIASAAALLANYGAISRAGLAKFYAGSCLGGWESPQSATGEPDRQSALLHDSLAEIFCSDFRGDIPPDSEPKVFRVRFAWQIDGANLDVLDDEVAGQATEIETDSDSDTNTDRETGKKQKNKSEDNSSAITGENFDDHVVDIIDLPEGESTEFILSEPVESSELAPVQADTNADADEEIEDAPSEPEPEPATQSDDNRSSSGSESSGSSDGGGESSAWWRRLAARAFANSASSSASEISTTAGEILSLAEETVFPDDLLEVFYTLDSRTWQKLGRVTRSNWREASFDLPLSAWTDLRNLQISVRNLPRLEDDLRVALDAVWLEVDYESASLADLSEEEILLLHRVELPTSQLFLSSDYQFSAGESPVFLLKNDLPDPPPVTADVAEEVTSDLLQASEEPQVMEATPEISPPAQLLNWLQHQLAPSLARASIFTPTRVLKTSVLDPAGKVLPIQPEIETADNQISLRLPNPGRSFRPGRYRLQVELLQGRQVLVTSTDFHWGVLALNASQSIYAPGDLAYLQFAVLSDTGHTICDADLELVITGHSGIATLSTGAGTITRNSTCGVNNATDSPDYSAHYSLRNSGSYTLTLTDLQTGRQISDALEVRAGESLVIERIAATRINPFIADYKMRLRVTSSQDFSGVITELVPSSFTITNAGGGVLRGAESAQLISWDLDLAAGETEELIYEYSAPSVSPQIYLLGPAEISQNSQVVFQENRSWQIAADAACQSNGTGGGNWSNNASWDVACALLGGPQTADTVQILSGDTITLDTSPSIVSITIDNGGTLTTDNNSRTLTLTTTSGTAFTNNGTFTSGNSTVVVNGNADITVLSGSFTGSNAFNHLTFSQLYSASRTYTMGAALDLNGDWLVHNTKTTTGATTLTVRLGGHVTAATSSTLTVSGAGLNGRTSFNTSDIGGTSYNVTVGKISLPTVLTGLVANASTITLNATSGTLFNKPSGTFNRGTSLVRFQSDGNVSLTAGTFSSTAGFNNLEISPALTADRNQTFNNNLIVVFGKTVVNPSIGSGSGHTLTVSQSGGSILGFTDIASLRLTRSGSALTVWNTNYVAQAISQPSVTIETGATLIGTNVSSSPTYTVMLTGTTTAPMWVQDGGTFTAGTSTVRVDINHSDSSRPPGAYTMTSGTSNFYNFTIAPVANSATSTTLVSTYTFGSDPVAVSNNFTINPAPSAAAPINLTVALGGNNLSVGATTTISVTPFGSSVASSTLSTSASNYNFTTGSLDIAHATSTLAANASSVTVTGNWVNSGTFDAGASTVIFGGSGTSYINTGGTGDSKDFNSLTIDKTGGATAQLITNDLSVSDTTTITSGVLDLNGRNYTNTGSISNSDTLQLQGDETVSAGSVTNNSGSLVIYTATSGSRAIKDWVYHHLRINGSGGTFTFPSAKTLGGYIDVNAGTLDTTGSSYNATSTALTIGAGGTFVANSSTVSLNGTSGTLFTRVGTFTVGSSLFRFAADADVTLTSGTITFNDVQLAPTITADRAYNFGSGVLTIDGDLTINPTAASAFRLTATMGAAVTVAAGKTTTITRTSSALSTLDTGSNHALTSGKINLATGGTFTANGSTITLTATTSTLFTRTGTLNAGTSTFVFNPDAAVTLTSGTVTFNNVQLSPTITADRTYSTGSGAWTVNGNLTINPDAASAFRLTASMGANITVAATATTTITGTNSALSTLDTTGSNRALSTGNLNIASAGTLTANGSTITLTGTSSTLFTRSGTFTAGTSTVVFNPNASVTLTSGTITFNNLTLNPTITSSSKTYTFGSGALTINGNFTIQPSATALSLTVNMGADITVAAGGTTSITRSSTATSLLDTTASNYALSTGKLNIATGGTLTANASTITLTAVTSTLFTRVGTFNAGTSTVVMNPNASVTLTSGAVTFYNLSLDPNLASSGKTYTFGAAAGEEVTINGDFSITPKAGSTLTLTVRMNSTLSVASGKTTSVSPATSALALLTHAGFVGIGVTKGFSTGHLVVGTNGGFTANGLSPNISGDLIINGTYVDADLLSGGTHTIGGNVVNNGFISATAATTNIAGNFTNKGTFTHNNGTVVLNGVNQAINGSATFYKLTKTDSTNDSTDRTLTLEEGETITVSNLLTLAGVDSDDRVNLVSSNPGNPSNLTVNGTFSLSWLDVADSNASGGILLEPIDSVDSLGNTNWDFGGLTIVVDSGTQAFPAVTPGGGVVATSSIISVRTGNHNGFFITVERANGALPTMRLTADTSVSIPDKTAWSPGVATTSAGNATASSTEPQTLQFRVRASGTDTPNYASAWWGANDTSASALFAGFPSTPQTIVNRSVAATATTSISVLYNLAVPVSQPSGAYSGDVLYTITANP